MLSRTAERSVAGSRTQDWPVETWSGEAQASPGSSWFWRRKIYRREGMGRMIVDRGCGQRERLKGGGGMRRVWWRYGEGVYNRVGGERRGDLCTHLEGQETLTCLWCDQLPLSLSSLCPLPLPDHSRWLDHLSTAHICMHMHILLNYTHVMHTLTRNLKKSSTCPTSKLWLKSMSPDT